MGKQTICIGKNKGADHTCDELLVWKWEIWISFQGDWGLLQGDYVSASKMHDFACFHATPSFLARLHEVVRFYVYVCVRVRVTLSVKVFY